MMLLTKRGGESDKVLITTV